MKELEDFCNKNTPDRRTSRLKPFEEQILHLYDKGYKVETIQEWLKDKKNVDVTVDAINKFKRNLSKKNFSIETLSSSAGQKNISKEEVTTDIEHKATNAFFSGLEKYQK